MFTLYRRRTMEVYTTGFRRASKEQKAAMAPGPVLRDTAENFDEIAPLIDEFTLNFDVAGRFYVEEGNFRRIFVGRFRNKF